MLNCLNYDCLDLICKHLDLKHEVVLAHTCKYLHYYFQDYRWRRTCRHISFSDYKFWYDEQNQIYFYRILCWISKIVEEIEFKNGLPPLSEPFMSLAIFPRVRSLRISFMRFIKQNEDDHILIITRLFPNLRQLIINGEITGKYIWNLKYLKELYLYGLVCNLKTRYYSRICKTLQLKRLAILYTLFSSNLYVVRQTRKCTSLQELKLEFNDLRTLQRVNGFKEFKNLRKLHIKVERGWYCFTLHDNDFSKPIESITCTINLPLNFWEYSPQFDLQLTQLRRLTFYRDFLLLGKFIRAHYKNWISLEELSFLYGEQRFQEKDQLHLLIMLTKCINLRLLDISGSPFGLNFVKRVGNVLAKQVERTQPLKLRCYKTQILEDDLECLYLPKNLEICFKKQIYDISESDCVKVIFKST